MVGIPPSPRGVPQIDVSFEVDANGIVSVSAKDKATGREQQMRITPTSGLTPDEIERYIGEAATHAEADREAKQQVILQNKLESLLRNTQKSFAKFGGLMSETDQDAAHSAFLESDAAVKAGSLADINKALDAMERVAGKLTAAMMNPTANITHEVEESR